MGSFFDNTEFAPPERRKLRRSRMAKGPAPNAPKGEKKATPSASRTRRNPLECSQLDCSACGLADQCKSPRMEPYGKGRSKILIVAEAPGRLEDEQGRPLVGDSGKLIRKFLSRLDIDMDQDCLRTNVVQCRPESNRTPTPNEIRCCYPRLQSQIKDFEPKLILSLGMPASKTILQAPFSLELEQVQGKIWPSHKWSAWVGCLPHPAYCLRNGITETDYQELLRRIFISYLDRKFPELPDPEFETVKDLEHLGYVTSEILMEARSLNLDWETNCLSPFDNDARILSLSITSDRKTYFISFGSFDDQSEEFRGFLRRILESELPKSIQGAQFEQLWARNHLVMEIRNVQHDSMLAAHVLDERKRATSLEYQVFERWGTFYKQEVDRANLEKASEESLARYNTLDTWTSYHLSLDQVKRLHRENQVDPFRFLHRANYWMMRMKERGIYVDPDRVKDLRRLNERNRKQFDRKLESLGCVKQFKKKLSVPKDPEKRWYDSTDQLREFLFGHLGLKPIKQTEKGRQASTDAESLKAIQEQQEGEMKEFCSLLLALKSAEKMEGTYLKNFVELADPNGYLHPNFSLHTVRTYRSCIAKGTMVLIEGPDGPKQIPIEDAKRGDIAYCFSDDLRLSQRRILWAGKTGHRKVMRMKGWIGGNTFQLELTPEHQVRTSTGSYCPAVGLALKDSRFIPVLASKPVHHRFGGLAAYDAEVSSIEEQADSVDVYDVEVDEYHNFIANGICVHNSSLEPNFQNIPKRNPIQSIVRRALVPKLDFFIEADYKAAEVRVIGMYSQDRTLIEYIKTGYDMHQQWAAKIYRVALDQVTKPRRSFVKNKWVFPEFYGAYWKSCARAFADQGLPDRFFEALDGEFWREFQGVKQWQEGLLEQYEKNHYIETFLGFRRRCPIERNKIINFPIQSTAFHMLLDGAVRVSERMEQEKLKSHPVAQVHDSLLIDTDADEIEQVCEILAECLTRKRWEWEADVPMEIEMEIGRDWHCLSELNPADVDGSIDTLDEKLAKVEKHLEDSVSLLDQSDEEDELEDD